MTNDTMKPSGSILSRHPRKAAATSVLAAAVAIATPFLMPFEGKRNVGYFDPSAIPTKCWGSTSDVVVGKRYTDAECEHFLTVDVLAHAKPLTLCITAPVSAETFAALVSFSYNAGPGTVCAKLAPLINAGRTAEACAKLTRYVYSRDRRTGRMKALRGLMNRRIAERKLCEEGLPR